MINKLLELKHEKLLRHANYMLIPVNVLGINDESMSLFNKIYFFIKNYPEIHKIVRTKSGAISTDRSKLRLPAYDIRRLGYCVEITILIKEGMWRIQFRNEPEKDEAGKILSGRKAFNTFKLLCKNAGIDLDTYAIDNGVEVKKTIEKPIITLERDSSHDRTYQNVHHIDFHNSYPGGLCNAYPEFRRVIEPLYLARKTNEANKAVLNYTVGFMQSIGGCRAKWAHLAKAAIEDNNNRVRELAQRLRDNWRVVISYNTDGIWYQGEIYHGEGEGKDIGQWENDHINCTFRAKSAGCYEYIENGVYHPVVRGLTKKDRTDPDRTTWKWGDIYQGDCQPIQYLFNEEKGIFKYEETN